MTHSSTKKIWKNGEFVDWEQATLHVSTHALHYGTAWFEGIRCYKTSRGSEIFRLSEHVNRLFNSCKIYRTEIPFSREEIKQAILETIRINELEHCYIRPLVLRGAGGMGLDPLNIPIECFIMVWEWGRYLGEESLKVGVDVGISSWNRAAPNTFPSMAKASGNYINSALIKMEAILAGFAEGIALDSNGHVSEGSGENIILIQDGILYTPPISSSILPGITRDSVLKLAKENNYTVIEQTIPREMLYLADEIFLTGTAAEVTPIRSVDHIKIGQGKRGPITAQLQQDFFNYVEGQTDDRHKWMTQVYNK